MIYRVRQLETADGAHVPEDSVLMKWARVDIPQGDYVQGAMLHNVQVLQQEQVELGELYEFVHVQTFPGISERNEVREHVRIVPGAQVESEEEDGLVTFTSRMEI